jgi:hypothetical protein
VPAREPQLFVEAVTELRRAAANLRTPATDVNMKSPAPVANAAPYAPPKGDHRVQGSIPPVATIVMWARSSQGPVRGEVGGLKSDNLHVINVNSTQRWPVAPNDG